MSEQIVGLGSGGESPPVRAARTIRPELMELLACPTCRAAVVEQSPSSLVCEGCRATYPVRASIPRMLPPALQDQVVETAEAFGWQWHAFSEQLQAFSGEFLEWLAPVTPDDLRGKRVLDAGCGKGRHLLAAAEHGVGEMVGLDISSAVEVARAATSHLPQVEVVQGDLLAPPFREGSFDLVYSIGVVHHVPRPDAAIAALARRLRPGGVLHVWVYAHEGNFLVRRLMDPVRRQVSRRVPRRLVQYGTLPLGVILLAAARVARRFPNLPLLPYRRYLQHIAGFSVRHVWAIVYDQLMAPTTHYVKLDELKAWFRQAGLTDIQIRNSRGMSWTGTGRRAAAP